MYDHYLIQQIESMLDGKQRAFPSIVATMGDELAHAYDKGELSTDVYVYGAKLLKKLVDGE